jgi:hypothetical protein
MLAMAGFRLSGLQALKVPQQLTPVILTTQEEEIRSISVQSQPGQIMRDPILKKPITHRDTHKKELVEWLKA